MKAVLPALRARGYEHLAIQEGGTASLKFLRVNFADVAEKERQRSGGSWRRIAAWIRKDDLDCRCRVPIDSLKALWARSRQKDAVQASNAAESTMDPEIERNLGEQPIARIMREQDLKPHDLVTISSVEMTHKMVARACKGRRLTLNTQSKVLDALNRATGKDYSLRDLFNY